LLQQPFFVAGGALIARAFHQVKLIVMIAVAINEAVTISVMDISMVVTYYLSF
jgi:hypothetical protein